MADEWGRMTLRAANVTLIDCDHRTPPAAEDGYPYVTIPQMRGGRIELAGARRISHEHYVEWTRKAKPSTNDVVLSRRCNPGETAVAPPGAQFALGQNLVLLRADGTKIYPPFLRWLVRGPDWWEQVGKFNNVGAVFDSLRCVDVPKFELPIPPLPNQRAIAHILDTLDDKVELNRCMSEALDAMARALFKSWFVGFAPARDKAEGRKAASPERVAHLFPSRLVDTELGPVPEGWRVARLDECVAVVRGLSYKGAGLGAAEDGVPMHNLNSIFEGGGYKSDGLKYYTGEYKGKHIARAGDLLVANTEQGHDRLLIGYAAIVPNRFGEESLFSHHLYRVRPKEGSGLTADYIGHLLNTTVMHDRVSGYANGTTVNMLPIDALQMPLIALPPPALVMAFDAIAQPARRRQEELFEESRTLAALRDSLLPKIVSGELRIKDAERFMERMT